MPPVYMRSCVSHDVINQCIMFAFDHLFNMFPTKSLDNAPGVSDITL